MKSEAEVRGALASHEADITPDAIGKIALRLGWSVERAQGYAEGVRFAYRWVLDEEAGE